MGSWRHLLFISQLRNPNQPLRPPSPSPSVPRHPHQIYGEPGPCHQKMRGAKGAPAEAANRQRARFPIAPVCQRCSFDAVQLAVAGGSREGGFLCSSGKRKGKAQINLNINRAATMLEQSRLGANSLHVPTPHPTCISKFVPRIAPERRIASKAIKLHHSEDLGTAGSFLLEELFGSGIPPSHPGLTDGPLRGGHHGTLITSCLPAIVFIF